MRKILFILVALVALTTSAVAQNYTPFKPTYKSEKADFNAVPAEFIYHFQYEGHWYIKFNGTRGSGIIHDPNCPCFAAEKQRQDSILTLLSELKTSNKNQYRQAVQEDKSLKAIIRELQYLRCKVDSLEAKND